MNFKSHLDERVLEAISDKETRDAYVADHVRVYIALALRAMREQAERGWSQGQLAEKMGTSQSVVSRLENPDYGRLSLQSLFEVASALDVPLSVEFPDWETWFSRHSRISKEELERKSFDLKSLQSSARSSEVRIYQFRPDQKSEQMEIGHTTTGSSVPPVVEHSIRQIVV